MPAQVLERQGARARVLFLADMPPVGFKVFEVRFSGSVVTSLPANVMKITQNTLENARYAVRIDDNGDIVGDGSQTGPGRARRFAPVRVDIT